ncbi:DUF3127 domain-containing protein [Chryseobacterium indoltheticum]|uniref:Domain of uncharacterized function (DUF3127) n=1 Tax=Chryseobacterium indoltheticum TaxID=254 RepID=A0A381FA67_9FLAO|nr:DUF3127 domain-containing protein [Chryseobacterium indoltheticum]AZA75889.1 DUF3127 domain-containing protein [Chryseobacterium indoltheticum]SIR24884.1 protein of unknown function [Chryseobacterium indoltheticum]SUX43470.1 Domain of uncharacterised function (DUF3127) [Chryseobacterium indoltheticum]
MELTGVIKKIGNIQTFGSGFQKREVVIVTEEQFSQTICLELISGKVDIIEPFSEGERAKIGINIKGREWISPQGETKYFNTIEAWKILKIQ